MQTLYGSDSTRPTLQKSVGERLPIRHWAPMLSTGNYFLYGGSRAIRVGELDRPVPLSVRLPLSPKLLKRSLHLEKLSTNVLRQSPSVFGGITKRHP